jgi:hypothetical protein
MSGLGGDALSRLESFLKLLCDFLKSHIMKFN